MSGQNAGFETPEELVDFFRASHESTQAAITKGFKAMTTKHSAQGDAATELVQAHARFHQSNPERPRRNNYSVAHNCVSLPAINLPEDLLAVSDRRQSADLQ